MTTGNKAVCQYWEWNYILYKKCAEPKRNESMG